MTMATTIPPQLPEITYIEARFYRRAPRRERPIWLVIHATHGAEGRGKARDGALELAHLPPDAPKEKQRSPHVFIDTGEVVQCVPWDREAWHAGHHANVYGEGFELCGRADQTRAQWFDGLSLPMLQLAARVLRWRAGLHAIPLQFVHADLLRQMKPGVTTHAEISKAFPADTNHTDPGPEFPMADLLAAAAARDAT